MGAVQNHL